MLLQHPGQTSCPREISAWHGLPPQPVTLRTSGCLGPDLPKKVGRPNREGRWQAHLYDRLEAVACGKDAGVGLSAVAPAGWSGLGKKEPSKAAPMLAACPERVSPAKCLQT